MKIKNLSKFNLLKKLSNANIYVYSCSLHFNIILFYDKIFFHYYEGNCLFLHNYIVITP